MPVNAAQPYIINANNLVAGYGTKTVIRNLFFNLPQASFLAVTGSNGSGKTTLFRLLTGTLPYSGSLQVNGSELSGSAELKYRFPVAGLPQKSDLNFSMPVRDLVVTGLFRHKKLFESYSHADFMLADAALESMGIGALSQSDFTQLSGGQQQLAWLAQLLVQKSRLMVLDEPAQYLDLFNRRLIFNHMFNWVNQGMSVVCITHDLQYLENREGYLLHLDNEHTIFEKISSSLLAEVRHRLEYNS